MEHTVTPCHYRTCASISLLYLGHNSRHAKEICSKTQQDTTVRARVSILKKLSKNEVGNKPVTCLPQWKYRRHLSPSCEFLSCSLKNGTHTPSLCELHPKRQQEENSYVWSTSSNSSHSSDSIIFLILESTLVSRKGIHLPNRMIQQRAMTEIRESTKHLWKSLKPFLFCLNNASAGLTSHLRCTS